MEAVIPSSNTAQALGPAAAEAQPQVRADRVLQLDILRGLAVLLVLFRHPLITENRARSHTFGLIARRLYVFGWTGVDLFFVLSGFLIGGLLFREIKQHGRLDVKRFLIRRGFKIWPSYFLLVALAMTLDARHNGWSHGWMMAWPNWVHLQNYKFPPPPNPMLRGMTWSLAVEEHFYLALPLILLFAPVRRRVSDGKPIAVPLVPWLALGVAILCLCLRLRNWNVKYQDSTHLFPTHLRMDGLLFGVLLAYTFHFFPALLARIGSYRNTLMLVGVALVAPMTVLDLNSHIFVPTFGLTMLYLGFGCILVAMIYTKPGEGWLGWIVASRASRALAFMGVFSYAIYLWRHDAAQSPMTHWVLPTLHAHLPAVLFWPVSMTIYIIWCTLAGVAVTWVIEGPALRVRDWLFPARARAMPAQAPVADAPAPALVQQQTPEVVGAV